MIHDARSNLAERMAERSKDRHASGGAPILVRLSKEDRARLETAVEAVRKSVKAPGIRVTLSGFVLDAALSVAEKILARGE